MRQSPVKLPHAHRNARALIERIGIGRRETVTLG
jgi:hypothetical protein